MACLLAVFVPQNCPPSDTFDKEVPRPPVSRAAAPHAAIAVLAPLRSEGELDRARPVQHVRALLLSLFAPCPHSPSFFSLQLCHYRELHHVLRVLHAVLRRVPARNVPDRVP